MSKKEKVKKPLYKKWWFWVIVVSLVGAAGTGLSGGGEQADQPPTSQTETQAPASTPEPSETPEGGSAEITPGPEVESSEPSKTAAPETADFVLDVGSLTDADVGPLDTGNLALKNGDLVSVNYGGDGVIVVKGKIQGLFTNDQTVKQNYFSVCDLIKNRGFDSCQELQYWAVSDMSNGEEVKVVSFTLDRATIESVANGNIIENQLGDYVSDLYIHPSLK